jgi:hypothetical protein
MIGLGTNAGRGRARTPVARNADGTRAGGFVLIAVLLFALIAAALAGSYLALSANDARLTRIAIDEQKAGMVAEAGLEYGLLKLKEVVRSCQLSPSVSRSALQSQLDAISPPPAPAPYAYVTPGGQSAFRIRAESDLASGTITNGNVARGSSGSFQSFSVTCGCRNTASGAAPSAFSKFTSRGWACI